MIPASTQPLIDDLWDFNDPSTSEQRFRAALHSTRDHIQAIEIRTQIARAQGLQRNFDQAHRTLDEIEKELEPGSGEEPGALARIRYFLERGRVFNSSGDKTRARPLFERAWQVARDTNLDSLAVDAAHMIAIVSPPDQAMSWNLQAVALAEQSSDPRARQWLASLHNNIAWTFHDRGEFAAALAQFEKALALRAQQNKPRQTRVAHWCVARALRSLGRVTEALTIQQALHADAQRASDSDGYISEELGECLLALDRPAEATQHFAAAYQLLSKDPHLSANERGRLQRLAQLAARRS
jgi:tetratricopeptide (TPR) repeat protein